MPRFRSIWWCGRRRRLAAGWPGGIFSCAKSPRKANCFMPPDVAEWIAKAEADWATAQREFRVRRRANHDAVCFHAQQTVEKYLKARLIVAGINFPRTHDLVALLALVQKAEPL